VNDVDAAIACCERPGLACEVATDRPSMDWTCRAVTVRSPNGFDVLTEEQPGR
jgi:hypothetical protein